MSGRYLGDVAAGVTVRGRFNTISPSNQSPITLAGTPALAVYKDAGTTESSAGVTLTVDFDGRTGLHVYAIDTSADGTFYSSGSDYTVVLTAGTVGGVSVVGAVVGAFSIGNRSGLRPTTAGRTLDVNANGEAGIDWANVGNPTTTLALTGTTVSGTQVVASVTGAVGSVTGNVGGNVTGNVGGSVGSVTGDVGGKVLGGGSGTIAGTGVRAVDASGNNVATASSITSLDGKIGSPTTGTLAGDLAAAKAIIDAINAGMIYPSQGAVAASPSPTTSGFTVSGGQLNNESDGYKGQAILFTSGTNNGYRRTIASSTYSVAGHALTFDSPFPAVPSSGDTVIIF